MTPYNWYRAGVLLRLREGDIKSVGSVNVAYHEHQMLLTTPDFQLWSELNGLPILADTSDWVIHKPFEMEDEDRRKLLDEHLFRCFCRCSMTILNRNGLNGG